MRSALRHFLQTRAFASTVRLLASVAGGTAISRREQLVIFKPDHIGDFVLASGAIRHLERWWKSSGSKSIKLVCSTAAAPLARREFPGCDVIAIPYSFDYFRSALVPCLRTFHAALPALAGGTLVCLRHQRTLVQDLMLQWADPADSYALEGSPYSLTEGMPDIRRFRANNSEPYPTSNPSGQCLELEANAALTGLAVQSEVPVAAILPHLTTFDVPSDDKSTGILVFPCAQFAMREYPAEKLALVISKIARQICEPVFLIAAPNDRAKLRMISQKIGALSGVGVEILAPNSILEAAERIARARLVLGMDSAPAHIATALDKPGVFIVGGGHPGFFAPWRRSERQIWLRNTLPCYGCNWKCTLDQTRCITDVEPDEMVEAAMTVTGMDAS